MGNVKGLLSGGVGCGPVNFKAAAVLAVVALAFGLAIAANGPASAQGPAQQSVAERCFEHHRFGAEPVDVAKTADGLAVLAQTSWNWHDAIGCYLTLDESALATLRAAPQPQQLPTAPTDDSRRCFRHHKFGESPVDVAKTADGQTVLARLSWGYHIIIGCYLVLDDTALATLRGTTQPDPTPEPTPEPTTDPTPEPTPDPTPEPTEIDLPPTGPQLTSIAVGRSHSCAIRADQTIACWGDNRYGQIDAPVGQYSAIAAADTHSCAIRADQTIACWGDNRYGQIDAPAGQFTAIATARFHSCAIRADRTIACWGDDRYGQVDAPAGQFTAIATAYAHSCAIRADQSIACWGNNQSGQVDPPAGLFAAIAADRLHSCAIRADRTIACWGNSRGSRTDAPAGQFTAIATAYAHSCAIRADQTIACWGDTSQGEADAPAGQFIAVAAGDAHSCAIRADLSIACWGNNQSGQSSVPARLTSPPEQLLLVEVASPSAPAVDAGRSFEVAVEFNRAVSGFDAKDINVVNGDVTRFSGSGSVYEATVTAAALGTVVVLIPRAAALDQDGRGNEPSQPFARTVRRTVATAAAIATGSRHSCTIGADQNIACWGQNDRGQIDAPSGQFNAVAGGEIHTCAIRDDQTIACWGENPSGQTDAPHGQFTAIATDTYHSCALRTDQTISCWGNNWRGQADAPSGHFTAVAAGELHSCALRKDQTIACWGSNDDWQGNPVGQADPPRGQFTAVAAGEAHTCAIRVDQTIACWGDNDDWQGELIGQTDPPPGLFTAITAGEWHSCAIRTDQTIACWGNNLYGQADAPAGQFTAIAAGEWHSCAIRIDQTIACWGGNWMGQLDVPQSQFTVITPSGSSFGSNSCGIKPDQTVDCWTDDGESQSDTSSGQFVAITPNDDFFDTWNREAARASAYTEFNRQEPDHGWTGDVGDCIAGNISQQYRDSIFRRVNWYRLMAGVNPIVEKPEYSALAQDAALIMAAQGELSHYPPDNWACWTQTGAEGAGKSNLGRGSAGVYGINRYMQDSGANNIAVGHRWWILNPNATEFGTGNVPLTPRSNALYVVSESWNPSSTTREARGFVAWPTPGFAPPGVNWGRWSFDLYGEHRATDFSTATVEVADEYGPVDVEIIYRRSSGMVWAMDGDTNSRLLVGRRPLHSLADSNYCYIVAVSGVKINDTIQTPYEYAVCIPTR